jgi:hypothetical protein
VFLCLSACTPLRSREKINKPELKNNRGVRTLLFISGLSPPPKPERSGAPCSEASVSPKTHPGLMLGSITYAQVAERPRNHTQFAMRPHPTLPGTFIRVKVDDLPAAERAKHFERVAPFERAATQAAPSTTSAPRDSPSGGPTGRHKSQCGRRCGRRGGRKHLRDRRTLYGHDGQQGMEADIAPMVTPPPGKPVGSVQTAVTQWSPVPVVWPLTTHFSDQVDAI